MSEEHYDPLGAPCKDCGKRTAVPNCHDTCAAYGAFRKQQEEAYRKRAMLSKSETNTFKRMAIIRLKNEIKRRGNPR